MQDAIRRVVESEWHSRLGITRSELGSAGVRVVVADLGSNAAMSFLFEEQCIIVVKPDQLDTTKSTVADVDVRDAFTEDFLKSLVGSDAQVDGPSWHGYVNERAFTGASDDSVHVVDRADEAFVEFLMACDLADVTESGFSLEADTCADSDKEVFWALRERKQILAGGLMSEWRGHQADVGVLTHPSHRGRGLARRVVATMVAATLPTADVVRYRALTSNLPSLAVARRLGFEGFGQNFRARRP